MGDVLSLIEKAQQAITEADAEKMQKKMRENSFTLSDYLEQFEMMKKMGGISALMGMLPGAKMKIREEDIDEKKIERNRAVILSMTPQERENPTIINSSRKRRISQGSGVPIQDINQLLRQFDQAKQMMKQMKSGKGKFKLPF